VNPAAYSPPNFEEGISMSPTNFDHIKGTFEHLVGNGNSQQHADETAGWCGKNPGKPL
jgi:hypothetical protein